MKYQANLQFLLASLVTLGAIVSTQNVSAQNTIFSCNHSQLTTVVNNLQGHKKLINWQEQKNNFTGNDLENLCLEVSANLQKYAGAGNLNYISTGKFNGQNFICASNSTGDCLSDNFGFLANIPLDRNPETVLQQLFSFSSNLNNLGGGKLVVNVNQILGNNSQTTSLSSSTQNTQNYVKYECLQMNAQLMTVAQSNRGTIPLIAWKSGFFNNSGYTPERRCQAVTARLQQHSDAKTLRYVSTGTINNQKVICVVDKSRSIDKGTNYKCRENGLLLTLEPNDNPTEILNNLFNLSSRVSGSPITRGEQSVVDINEFLDKTQPLK